MPDRTYRTGSLEPDSLSGVALRAAQRVAGQRIGYAAVLGGALLLSLLVAVVPSALTPAPVAIRVGNVVVGLLFVISGLVGIGHRPRSPVGPLLVAAGFSFLLGRLQGADPAVLSFVAVLANVVWQGIVFYVVFSFPHSRLRSRGARAIVVVAVAYTLANNLFGLVTSPTRPTPDSPANPFYLSLDEAVREPVRLVLLYVGGGFIVVATGWLVRRWLAASPPLRRALTPIYAATVLVSVVALVLRFVVGIVAPTTDPGRVVSIGLLVAFGLVPVAFLVGLLRARIARSGVADLVVQLSEVPSVDRLRDALAKALGDPGVEVLAWSDADPDTGEGEDPSDASTSSGKAVTVIEPYQGPPVAIRHDQSLLDDPGLIGAVATAVRLTLDNERLEARVRAQLEEVRASRARIAAAADAARSRIERDIHDGTQQQLVAAAMALRAARDKLDDESEAVSELDDVSDQLAMALDELRELARGIHPAVLSQRGLKSALAALARRSAVPVRTELALGDGRLPQSVETAAYFIASEALSNAQTHSGASEVTVSAAELADRLIVSVAEDGIGGADVGRGSGMAGMRDRAETVGGTLRVMSPPGGPTEITAELPRG